MKKLWFPELDSTSTHIRRMIDEGSLPSLPLAVATQKQTAGRGRQGREWLFLEDNLATTIAWKPLRPLQEWGSFALAIGLAVVEGLAQQYPESAHRLTLKWPNDVLLDQKKMGGILLENYQGIMLVGIGLNVKHAPQMPNRKTIALADAGVRVSPEAMLGQLASWFESMAKDWDSQGWRPALRDRWLQRSPLQGQRMTVHTPHSAQLLHGIGQGIDAQGALLLRTDDGMEHVLHAGEVFFSHKV
jgi:BirA family biotin operon repressor/biotin-[acetyl-CoA-carboxylase] ligase